jgi:CRP/FNR family cyclic AMP-dependent transcriptional regulator
LALWRGHADRYGGSAEEATVALSPAAHTALDQLAPHLLQRLLPWSEVLRFDTGVTVLREGVDTPFLGVIETGRVALRLRLAERGERLTLVTVETGELLGWSALVAPHRATVDAVVTEPSRIRAFEASRLRSMLAEDCELAAALLPLALETVSGRLNASWSQLLDMYGRREDQAW